MIPIIVVTALQRSGSDGGGETKTFTAAEMHREIDTQRETERDRETEES